MKVQFCGQVQTFRHLMRYFLLAFNKERLSKEVWLNVIGRGTEYQGCTAGSLVKYLGDTRKELE